MERLIQDFLHAVVSQNKETMPTFFHKDARVIWPNTNENFDVSSYVRANCEYPGNWKGTLLRVEAIQGGAVSVARVYDEDGGIYVRVVSFYKMRDGKIAELEEYWSDDGEAPDWRKALFSN